MFPLALFVAAAAVAAAAALSAVHAQTLVLNGVAYPAAIAAYGPLVTTTVVARAVVSDPPEGCVAPTNAAALSGAIVLLSASDPVRYADGCNAARRNLLAARAGAAAVVIVFDVTDVGAGVAPPTMPGLADVAVPCVSIVAANATALLEAAAAAAAAATPFTASLNATGQATETRDRYRMLYSVYVGVDVALFGVALVWALVAVVWRAHKFRMRRIDAIPTITLSIVALSAAARIVATLVAFDNARGLLTRSGFYVLGDLPDPIVACALLANAYMWYAILRKIDLARGGSEERHGVVLFAFIAGCFVVFWLAGTLASAEVQALDPGFRGGVLIAMLATVLAIYGVLSALVLRGVRWLRQRGYGGDHSRIVAFLIVITCALVVNIVLVALLISGGVVGKGDPTALLALISIVTAAQLYIILFVLTFRYKVARAVSSSAQGSSSSGSSMPASPRTSTRRRAPNTKRAARLARRYGDDASDAQPRPAGALESGDPPPPLPYRDDTDDVDNADDVVDSESCGENTV